MFSASRTGEVIKKYDLRSPQPLSESQWGSRFIDNAHLAVGQSFTNNVEVLANTFGNAMMYALKQGAKFKGPCYQQPGHVDPESSATAGNPSAGQFLQPTSLNVLPQMRPCHRR